MKQKILILDLDGTLTNSKKEITEKTLHALLAMQERGHKIVIATGRPAHGVKWISDILQLEKFGGYVLCFNGARVMNATTKEIIYQQRFPKEYMAPLYEFALTHDMGMVTYRGSDVITGTRVDKYMEFEANLNFMELVKVEDFVYYIDFDINKCLFSATEDVALELEKELASLYEGKLSVYRSEPFFIEAMPLGVDKAASLSKLFESIGVDRMDTVACGDGFNDMSMIQYAGVGVAMKNAQDVVKEVADVITKKTNDEDGLIEIIDEYFS